MGLSSHSGLYRTVIISCLITALESHKGNFKLCFMYILMFVNTFHLLNKQ